MAVYKVIQDIEAEDKLLGPLSLKSFVYAGISITLIYINFRILIAGGPLIVRLLFILVLFFPMLLFGVLASPLGRQQPTEVWLLAHIKFLIKPRVRVWDQSGLKQLVTITVPKKVQKQLTKDFNAIEARSRLQALATTLDSRGWAIKNVSINTNATRGYLDGVQGDSDRLVAASSVHQDTPVVDVHPSDDILDENNNATAQNLAVLVQQSEDNRKKKLADKIEAARASSAAQSPAPAVDTTFLDNQPPGVAQPKTTTFVGKAIVGPGQANAGQSSSATSMTAAEQELLDKKHREEAEIESKMPKNFGRHPAISRTPTSQPAGVTPQAQAAKLELAQSGNDLSVATIASLANRANQLQQIGPNEFVMSLH